MDGILNIYKPSGITSHDVVLKIRRMLPKKKRVGHAGTLDPDAKGVLIVCVGKGTRLVEFFMDFDKVYRGEMVLGVTTDTQDASGRVIKEVNDFNLNIEYVKKAFQSFTGQILQIPPMYSALRHGGMRLYDLARKGQEIERKPRPIKVYSLECIGVKDMAAKGPLRYGQRLLFETAVSKGTYVRTLCHDIGIALGCGAHLDNLERLSCGPFVSSDSYTMEEVEAAHSEDSLQALLEPLDKGLGHFPAVYIKEESIRPLINGIILYEDNLLELPVDVCLGNYVRLYSPKGEFLAIGETIEKEGRLGFHPRKVFN